MEYTSERSGRCRKWVRLVLVAALPGLLAACASNSDGSSPLADFFGGGVSASGATVENPDYDPDFFLKSEYCPPVQIRQGTEALVVYERGHEKEAEFVRYQGSIAKTARECSASPGQLAIKLGVAGRAVAGPKGGPGIVTLPLRVAVVKQQSGDVLYSQMFQVQVTMSPPSLGANFSQVIEQIVVPVAPNDRDLIVYVGFDEGTPSGGAATG